MTKNLKTADQIVKFTLSSVTILFYFVDIIKGPFAMLLVILSVTVLVVNLIRLGIQQNN